MIKVQITTEDMGHMGEFTVASMESVKQTWSHLSGVTIKAV